MKERLNSQLLLLLVMYLLDIGCKVGPTVHEDLTCFAHTQIYKRWRFTGELQRQNLKRGLRFSKTVLSPRTHTHTHTFTHTRTASSNLLTVLMQCFSCDLSLLFCCFKLGFSFAFFCLSMTFSDLVDASLMVIWLGKNCPLGYLSVCVVEYFITNP